MEVGPRPVLQEGRLVVLGQALGAAAGSGSAISSSTASTSDSPTIRRIASAEGGASPSARKAAWAQATMVAWLSTSVPSQSKTISRIGEWAGMASAS